MTILSQLSEIYYAQKDVFERDFRPNPRERLAQLNQKRSELQRVQGNNRELRAKIGDEALIGRHKFAAFAFSQCNVDAIVDPGADMEEVLRPTEASKTSFIGRGRLG